MSTDCSRATAKILKRQFREFVQAIKEIQIRFVIYLKDQPSKMGMKQTLICGQQHSSDEKKNLPQIFDIITKTANKKIVSYPYLGVAWAAGWVGAAILVHKLLKVLDKVSPNKMNRKWIESEIRE